MAITQTDIDEAYAQGQKDGANNRYKSPPVQASHWTVGILRFATDDQYVLQDAYDKGYEHGRSQR
ncbi:MAG: hypothetical protein ACOYON_07555 [Fimbriimonas sp.]